MSYHLNEIPRGVFGEISKIDEELCELVDAVQQGNKIMTLCELSDIVGAIEGFLEKLVVGLVNSPCARPGNFFSVN